MCSRRVRTFRSLVLVVNACWRFRYTVTVKLMCEADGSLNHLKFGDVESKIAAAGPFLLLGDNRKSPFRFKFKSRILGVVFVVTLSSCVYRKHARCDPLKLALDTISEISKLRFDNAINSEKWLLLQNLLLTFPSYLLGVKTILDDAWRGSLKGMDTREGLSRCYYSLRELCRLLRHVGQFMKECIGELLSARVLTIYESPMYFEFFFSDLQECMELVLIKVEEFAGKNYRSGAAFPIISKSLCLPRQYWACLLQIQAKKDRSRVLDKLKQNTPKPFWVQLWHKNKKKLTSEEEIALTNLLSQRLEYEPRSSENIYDFLRRCLYVERKFITAVKPVGAGSFGIVQEVNCFGEKYAMKTIRGISNIELLNEAVIQARLQHPHIVKLVWYSKDVEREGSLSFLMELLEMDLETLIGERMQKKGSPLWKCPLVAVDIMLQIAQAMKYLHEKGIMHRDLKSANVLVDMAHSPDAMNGFINVKVGDFGLAKVKAAGASQMTNTANVGTKWWRAPEVFWSENREDDEDETDTTSYSFSADVYSFAMTGYEILTGKEPFANLPRAGLMERIVKMNQRPVLPEHIHPQLLGLINRCWDGCPEVRPSFETICEELQHFKDDLLFGHMP